MSWSFGPKTFDNVSAAKDAVYDDKQMPAEIKALVFRGLTQFREQSRKVSISGHGHTCDSPTSFEDVTCTLNVCYAPD